MIKVHVRHPADPAAATGVDLAWSKDGRVHAWLDELGQGSVVGASDAVRDFVAFAVSAYAADKAVLRNQSVDRWTRTIELHVPLVQPDAWPVNASERLLHRLTGDNWTVVPTKPTTALVSWPAAQLTGTASPSEVALFSGGLDSLSYLGEVLQQQRAVEFVAHYDPNARKSGQRSLFDLVCRGATEVRLRQFAVQLAGPDPVHGDIKENTTRARVVVFVAGAVAVAQMTGAQRVVIPENGFVSVNVPLGPSRIGSLSTRTTHPLTVHLFQHLLNDLGVSVLLQTPYEYMTKGEVVAKFRNAALTPAAIAASISCAHPLQGRWRHAEYGNCGYCYACLVRRASLEVSGGDPTAYAADPRRTVGAVTGTDFRALVTALGRPLRPGAVVAAGPTPDTYDVATAFAMIERGYDELRKMVDNGLAKHVRVSIGW